MRTRTHVPHCVDSRQSVGVTVCNPPMNELASSPERQSDRGTFQRANGPNDRLCPPLFPGKLINPIVVSCLDRTEFCDWIQHFKAADVPVLSPPPPVYDIIYTPTHREVRRALPKPPREYAGRGIKSNACTRRRSDMQFPHFCSLLSRLHSSAGGAEPVKSKRSSDNRLGVAPTTSRYPFIKKTLFHQDIQSRSV